MESQIKLLEEMVARKMQECNAILALLEALSPQTGTNAEGEFDKLVPKTKPKSAPEAKSKPAPVEPTEPEETEEDPEKYRAKARELLVAYGKEHGKAAVQKLMLDNWKVEKFNEIDTAIELKNVIEVLS